MIELSRQAPAGAPHVRLRARRKVIAQAAFLVVASCLGFMALDQAPQAPAEAPPVSHAMPSKAVVKLASVRARNTLFDPGFSLGYAPRPLSGSAPLEARLQGGQVEAATVVARAAPEPALSPSTQISLTQPQAETSRLLSGVPLPLPRPSELRAPVQQPAQAQSTAEPEAPRIAAKPTLRRPKTAAATASATETDNRNFIQKLFGMPQQPAGPALAYAPTRDEAVDMSRSRRLTPALGSAPGTAVYDISAQTVYMPNGEKLEAHSGLGDKLDDPRYAHVRMQGVTPPHVYNLTEREALFHGVRALRLNPVGGSGAIHGRAGLLAHTYLLGPKGDSNGCVSFKDYEKFLQAYLRGEVKRLVVVASMS